MKKLFVASWLIMLATVSGVWAEIKKIEDNGAEVILDDVLPYQKPAVIVFYTAWDQDSINLMKEVEDWAGQYYDLTVVFIDCVNEDSNVYKQFELEEIPSIIVYDTKQERVGDVLFELEDLEDLVRDRNLLN